MITPARPLARLWSRLTGRCRAELDPVAGRLRCPCGPAACAANQRSAGVPPPSQAQQAFDDSVPSWALPRDAQGEPQ